MHRIPFEMREIIVDNFAGGGGASKGIEIATGKSVDIAYIIPECWYEEVRFGEEFFAVDMPVIAWRPHPEPYRGDED